MGTFGYLAPEFTTTGKLTFQCDVFLYGVVLLELITGRRPVDTARMSMDDTLVKWLRDWLDLSLNHSVPSSLLILSRAFTVSGKLKPEEVVRATSSSFPDEVSLTLSVKGSYKGFFRK